MANHDLILGQNRDLNLGHSHQQLCLGHNNHVGLDLGQSNDLDLGHTTEDHEQSYSLPQNHENNQSGLDLGQNQNPENKHGGSVDDEQHQMVIAAQHHDLGLGDDHELVVSDGSELEQNLELVVDQNQEMGLEASDDMVQQHHLLVSTPVVQSRALALNPNYELAVGQEFPDAKSCRRALRDAVIALHFEIQTVKSDKMNKRSSGP